jgi:hypothetical protein
VLQMGDFVTLDFNLSSKGTESEMKLDGVASGIVRNGKIDLAQLNAGSFSEGPKPPVKVSGTMADSKLALTFEPLPTKAADGFQVGGKLEALKMK